MNMPFKSNMMGRIGKMDIEGQIEILERAIHEKPSAIILAASDYNLLVPIADKINVDSGISSKISSSFIATDNYAAGGQAG